MAHRETTAGTGSETDRGTARKAMDKAKDVGHDAQEKVSHVASEVKHRGEDLVHEGKDKARDLSHKAADKTRSEVDQQRHRLSGGMHNMASALRRSSHELPEDQRTYGKIMEAVADRVDGVSRYIEQHDANTLARDARRFARDHAPVFLSGAFTLGLLGARFLKSSGDEARRQREQERFHEMSGETRWTSSRETGWYGTGAEQQREEPLRSTGGPITPGRSMQEPTGGERFGREISNPEEGDVSRE